MSTVNENEDCDRGMMTRSRARQAEEAAIASEAEDSGPPTPDLVGESESEDEIEVTLKTSDETEDKVQPEQDSHTPPFNFAVREAGAVNPARALSIGGSSVHSKSNRPEPARNPLAQVPRCIHIEVRDYHQQGDGVPQYVWTPSILRNVLHDRLETTMGDPTEVFIETNNTALLFWGRRSQGEGISLAQAEAVRMAIQGEMRYVGDLIDISPTILTLTEGLALCQAANRRKKELRKAPNSSKNKKNGPQSAKGLSAEAERIALLEAKVALLGKAQHPTALEESRMSGFPNLMVAERGGRTAPFLPRTNLTQVPRTQNNNNSGIAELGVHQNGYQGLAPEYSTPSVYRSDGDRPRTNGAKVKLPCFSDEASDGVSYRIWRHDVRTYMNQGARDDVLIRAMLESLKGLPGEVARTVSEREGPDGIIAALDLKYKNAENLPALIVSFYTMEQKPDESPASWAARLSIKMKELKTADPMGHDDARAEYALAYQFVHGSNARYFQILDGRLDAGDDFTQLQKKARSMEASVIQESHWKAFQRHSKGHASSTPVKNTKRTGGLLPHYVKAGSLEAQDAGVDVADQLDGSDEEEVNDADVPSLDSVVMQIASSLEGLQRRCFVCQSPDHLMKDCPKRALNSKGSVHQKKKTPINAPRTDSKASATKSQ